MKIEELSDAINHIDDDLIEEASKIKQASKAKKIYKTIWVRVCAAACCAVLIGITAHTIADLPESSLSDQLGSIEDMDRMLVAAVSYPASYAYDDIETWWKIIEENPVEDKIYKAIEGFGYNTASKILTQKDENMLYSPISFYYALSLVTAGADGETQAELLELLGVSDAETLAAQSSNLYRLLYTDNERSQLRIANSLWLSDNWKGMPIRYKDKFLGTAVNDYYASLFSADFTDENTGKAMGKWVSENTNGTLEYDYESSAEQFMSILNTIYFYDEWIDRFDEEQTKEDIFTLAVGEEVTCDYMNHHYESRYFYRGDNFTRSELELKGKANMVFILPDESVDVSDLISEPEKLQEIFNGGEEKKGEVIWQIPKFSYDVTLKLGDALKDLGVQSAFDLESANFTGITNDITTFISDVKQKTHIAIDEKGVTASAYTEIILDGGGMTEPEDKAEMILNRPFIYGIQTYDGTLLFVGVCNNPVG